MARLSCLLPQTCSCPANHSTFHSLLNTAATRPLLLSTSYPHLCPLLCSPVSPCSLYNIIHRLDQAAHHPKRAPKEQRRQRGFSCLELWIKLLVMALHPVSLPSSTDQNPTPTSDDATNLPNPYTTQPQGGGSNGEDTDITDRKPDLVNNSQDSDAADYVGKYSKYEADYVHRLMAKYFSKKDLYGGNIYDEEMTIENETIKASRWPCMRSFADPVPSFEDLTRSPSATAEASGNLPNKKLSVKKCNS